MATQGKGQTPVVQEPAVPVIEVVTSGGPAIYITRPLEERKLIRWDGQLPRNLFVFFVYMGPVTRETIFQAFWPDLTIKEATNVFHVTKRKITEAISGKSNLQGEQPEESDYVTTFSKRFYYLNSHSLNWRSLAPKALELTVPHNYILRSDAFLVNEAYENHYDLQYQDIVPVLQQYPRLFMPKVDLPWINEVREQMIVKVGDLHWRAAKVAPNVYAKPDHLQRALALMPYREDITLYYMRVLVGLGMPLDAVKAYQALAGYLAENGGMKPDENVTHYYQEVLDRR